MKKWLSIAALVIGILAVCALVWFLFPFIAFGEYDPFESGWVRLAIIVFILAVFFAYLAWRFYKRRKASEKLAKAIVEPQAPDSDAKVLSEKMSDALLTLKKSHKTRGDFLYELPWYMIIGPPGAGKTTALLNSGLKFPLLAATGKATVAGVGGTRYCDWWFTEDAVLIDTAGRYTTQDSDAGSDSRSWLAFLDLLKKSRPRQPINGVLVAISLEDLLTLPPEEITAHAIAIKKRLTELHDQLQINFPVYALFTKADLISGFMEFFGDLNESDRRQVWGATFQTANKNENRIADVEPEFELLLQRLSEELPDRLQEEADPVSRVRLFGFPSQMAALKPAVVNFLNQIFEPTRYHIDVALRGFYFTSGTQEGTTIDKVLGALSASFGKLGQAAPAYSGRGKSFFLTNLLTKVIFGEAGWVSYNRAGVRRERIIRYSGYALITAITLAVLGAWWVSYLGNSKLIAGTETDIERYSTQFAPVIQEATVADTDLKKTLDLLRTLKNMVAGYGHREEPTPIPATFGLSQRERLLAAATTAYRTALDRTFRSRLILRLERQLQENQNDPVFTYSALKVYFMLGGLPEIKVDRSLVEGWLAQDWEELYPGPANRETREALAEHLKDMLDIDPEVTPPVKLNETLIQDAQRRLVQMSLKDRAYALIKSNVIDAPVEDWIPAARSGDEFKNVFETVDGSDVEAIRVPKLFTYYGFQDMFLTQLETVADQLKQERWVLGKAGEQAVVEKQDQTLTQDLLDLYRVDFINAWNAAIGKLKLKPLAAGKPTYDTLRAASGPTSPIKLLIESIAAETMLTAERDDELDKDKKAAGGGAGDAVAKLAAQKALSKLPNLAKTGVQILKKSRQRAGASSSGGNEQIPGANIEAQFKRYHLLTKGEDGQRPIDVLVKNLGDVYAALIAENVDKTEGDDVPPATSVSKELGNLRKNGSTLPAPFDAMIDRAVDEFENNIVGGVISELGKDLRAHVANPCEDLVKAYYPFAPKSPRDIPIGEFGKLFAPGGIIDKFFNENLARFVDMTKDTWVWKKESNIGKNLSPTTLRQFQNAAIIRDVFFANGGNSPSINLTVTSRTLSQNATGAEFEINGDKLATLPGILQSKDFVWPKPGGTGGSASVTVLPQETAGKPITFSGPWALYRLLNSGGISKSGEDLSVSFVVGGMEVSYGITVGTVANPFALPALRNFSCPSGL